MTTSRVPECDTVPASRAARLRVASALLPLFALVGLLCSGPRLSAQAYGMSQRAPIGPFLNGRLPTAAPSAATGWTVVDAFPNLAFKDPTFLTFAPGTNRLYVTTLWGVIYQFTNDPSTTAS